MPSREDLLFGNIAARLRLAKPEHVNLCLEHQAKEEAGGAPRKTLGRILVERGYLTAAQVEIVLDEQRKQAGPKMVGPYQLIGKLGEGGMGTVYIARVPKTGAQVALKLLPKQISNDAAFLTRFKREATVGLGLEHPNLVRTLDVGEDHGVPFMALEYVDGGDLGKRLAERGVLPEREALAIVRDVARALQHAHERGLVHRDIKPSNIMFMKSGQVKLSDFGLVKSTDPEASRLTQTGMAVGTPHYIAPEQARAEKDLDIRADLYALGATLYHLVTGQTPFQGDSAVEVITKHLTEEPVPPEEINPSLGEECVWIIEKLMAKDRADRYAQPSLLAADIDRVLRGEKPVNAGGPTAHSTAQLAGTRRAGGRFAARVDSSRPRGVPATGGTTIEMRRPSQLLGGKVPFSLLAGGIVGAGLLLGLLAFFLMSGGKNKGTPTVEENLGKNVKTEPTAKSAPASNPTPSPQPPLHPTPAPQDPKDPMTEERDAREAFNVLARFEGLAPENKTARVQRLEDFLEHHGHSIVGARARAMLRELTQPPAPPVPPGPGPTPTPTPPPPADNPLETRIAEVLKKLQGLNPGYEHLTKKQIENGKIKLLCFGSDPKLKDLTPVPELLEVTEAHFHGKGVKDLKALRGLKVRFLDFSRSAVTDLGPLAGMPLYSLRLSETGVQDLAPLKDMKSLRKLFLEKSAVRDLSPVRGLALTHLDCRGAAIANFTILRELPLTDFWCDDPGKIAELLKAIPSLERINEKPASEVLK